MKVLGGGTRIGAALLSLVIAGAVFAGCGGDSQEGSAASGGLIKLRVAQANQAANFTSFISAIDEGIFKKHGLDVDPVLTEQGGQAPGLLQSGRVQFALDSGEPMVTAISRGVDLTLLGATGNNFGFVVIARKPITRVEDLAGKKLALSSPTGAVGTAGSELLRRYKLQDKVDVVYIADIAARLAALDAGSVDAIILSPPVHSVMKSGKVNQILDMRKDFHFLMVGIWAMRDYVKDHPDVAEKFLAAMNEAQDFVNDPANKEAVIEDMKKATGFEERADLEESYDYEVARLPDTVEVDRPAVQNVVDYLNRKGEVKAPDPDSFLDLEPMKKALGTG